MATNKTNAQLMTWVSDPNRTVAELKACYNGLMLPAPVPTTKATLVPPIMAHLAAQPAANTAVYQPAPAAPRTPRPTPTPAPVTPTPAPAPALTINGLPLPAATANVAYGHTLTTAGGTGVLRNWSLVGAPAWLTINNMGQLSGTPRTAGTTNFTISVNDGSNIANVPATVTVNPGTNPAPLPRGRFDGTPILWGLGGLLGLALLVLGVIAAANWISHLDWGHDDKPPVSSTCPAVAGFTVSDIDGGCLYKAGTPTDFSIPSGWDAWFGIPAHWQLDGVIKGVTQVSLYKDDASHKATTSTTGDDPCPTVAGYTCSAIDGGYQYTATTPTDFSIPSGWDAWFGIPAHWQTEGTIPAVTTVSLYKDDAKHVTTSTDKKDPTATATPPATATATVSNGTKVSATCPSLEDARKAFGVDVTLVGEEPCAYTWNSGNGSFKAVIRAAGWIINSAESDGLVYVRSGDGTTVSAKASTWRKVSEYPGLTLEKQFELLTGYAAIPQNAFSTIVRCPECNGFPPIVKGSSNTNGAPSVNGFDCSTVIDGGFQCKSTTAKDFTIPDGWKALYGTTNTWQDSGVIKNVTTVSLYRK